MPPQGVDFATGKVDADKTIIRSPPLNFSCRFLRVLGNGDNDAVETVFVMQPLFFEPAMIRSCQSGGVSGVVGLATVRSEPRDDPKNPKSAVVELEFAGRLDPPTSLAEIKQSKLFDDWALVRQGRLSTMAAPDKFVEWMRARYPGKKI